MGELRDALSRGLIDLFDLFRYAFRVIRTRPIAFIALAAFMYAPRIGVTYIVEAVPLETIVVMESLDTKTLETLFVSAALSLCSLFILFFGTIILSALVERTTQNEPIPFFPLIRFSLSHILPSLKSAALVVILVFPFMGIAVLGAGMGGAYALLAFAGLFGALIFLAYYAFVIPLSALRGLSGKIALERSRALSRKRFVWTFGMLFALIAPPEAIALLSSMLLERFPNAITGHALDAFTLALTILLCVMRFFLTVSFMLFFLNLDLTERPVDEESEL